MTKGKTMLAILRKGIGKVEIREVNIPKIGPDEVLIKVKSCGICGSDLARIYEANPKWDNVILGHECSGVVEKRGRKVRSLEIGERVILIPLLPCHKCKFCKMGYYSLCLYYSFIGSRQNGGFAEYVKAPAINVLKIPKRMDFDNACLVEPLSIGVHGLFVAKDIYGKRIAIFGAGTIGLLTVCAAKYFGAQEIVVIDIVEEKLKIAKKCGASHIINASQSDVVKEVKKITNGEGEEIVLECSGAHTAQRQSFDIIGKRGTILFLGTSDKSLKLEPEITESIARKELKICGSWMSYSLPFPGEEWHRAMKIISLGKVHPELIITHKFPLGQAVEAFKLLKDSKKDNKPVIKVLLKEI